MVQFLSIIFFLGFLQFLLGFSKVTFFVSLCICARTQEVLMFAVYAWIDLKEQTTKKVYK